VTMTARITLCGFVTVALYALEQHLIDAVEAAQRGSFVNISAAFIHSLPYPFLFSHFTSARTYLLLGLIGLAQTIVLYALYRLLRGIEARRRDWGILGLCALAMLALALRAHALLSSDAYAYVGYAKIGGLSQAYAPPPNHAFHANFTVLNRVFRIWGPTTVPSYYGPLWVLVSAAIVSGTRDLASAIFAFRLLEVAPLWVIIAVLARRDRTAAALFALNPAIYALYIANAHNDLFAFAFVMLALAVAEALPWLGALLVILASLVKIPLAAFAFVVFSGSAHLKSRLPWLAITLTGAALAAALLGGGAYIHDLLHHSESGWATAPGTQQAAHGLVQHAIERGLMLVAVVALIAVFVTGWVARSGAFSFIKLTPVIVRPWYAIWGLPYAALDPAALAAFLVALPFFALLEEIAFPPTGLGHAAMAVVVLFFIGEVVLRGRAVRSDGGSRSIHHVRA
jgi:hypothetical protein